MQYVYVITIKGLEKMAKLTVDIQEGFRGDSVVVKVDGKVAFSKDGVTTQLLRGPAAAFSTEVNDSGRPVKLHVIVKTRNLEGSKEYRVNEDMHVGISIEESGSGGGKEEIVFREGPFGYL